MKAVKISLFLLWGLCSGASYAQGSNHEWQEKKEGGYTYKFVSNDPMKARFYTLPNGLTVILSPTHKEPRIHFFIATKAGSKTDPADHTGLAHYLEHMMFKGTENYGSLDWSKESPLLGHINGLYEEYNHAKDENKRKAIYRQIDSISGAAAKFAIANEYDKMMSSMGAKGTNAFTSFEQTVYTEDIPSNAVDKFLKVQADRFKDPVFRIFHTELEAVYEEKNRTLDNDNRKVSELMLSNLFVNHNYGKQTTIGTVEHLKNPSLLEIRKYYNTYYVPNNMGVIVSGDFNPDEMIKKVDQYFSYMQNKPVPKYTFKPEAPITAPIVKEVYGPDAEFVAIGYRYPGVHSKDALMADLVGQILTNGKAGLIDLNLVKKQKLLRASASADILIDYGYLNLQGVPTLGQSVEDVKTLMLGEIENLKKGNFDDDLLVSIVNNQKKAMMQASEKYNSRAYSLMAAFTGEEDWLNDVAYTDQLSKLTRKDIIAFANKYFGENYVVVYKRKGEDKNIVKVDKPTITPVETNPNAQSPFVKTVVNMPVTQVKPVWVDYDKDLKKGSLGPAEVLYVHNDVNGLFRLAYRYKMGTWSDKKLAIAAQYLQFLGTDKMSSENFSKEFYKLACNFSMKAENEYTTVSLEGLQENFGKAVALLENLMTNCRPDEDALTALKARINKSRADAKNNKGAIMSGIVSYARYGAENPFNNVLSNDELKNLTSAELTELLHSLPSFSHRIIYYGPESMTGLTTSLKDIHRIPNMFRPAPSAKVYTYTTQSKNEVLFADYDMVQSEIRWVRNIPGYDPAKQPSIDMFNNYFGGGMGSLVFQTIRESKALAYSTYSYVGTPDKKEDPYFVSAYIGCQADKFNESITAMNELLNDLPSVENNMLSARSEMKKDIETERITEDDIIYNYLTAERKGLHEDIRKSIYENADKLAYNDLKKFHSDCMSNKPYTYCIVASEKKLKADDVQKIGTVKKLSMNEIFGY
ncbi:MAG: insulinase family protein [Flavipsychrobacter sp.]|nr:insulinase family protein [Flavipsychrobacter sp.]